MSQRILVFSDFHAHAWSAYSRPKEWSGRLINSRLLDHVRVLDQMEAYCLENNIDRILFGGDLFHERQKVGTVVFNTIFRRFMAMKAKGIELFLLPGNHDQVGADIGTDHALVPFKTFCTVMDAPGRYPIEDGVHIYACPFLQDERKLVPELSRLLEEREPEVNDVLLLHLGLSGARIGPTDWLIQDGLSVDALPVDHFRFTFLGHYHTHQLMQDGVMYVGSTLQHNWNDEGQDKYFVDYDLETGVIRPVKVKAPRFVRVDQNDLVEFDFDEHVNDFVRITYSSLEKEDKAALKKAHQGMTLEFVPKPRTRETDTSISLDLSSSKEEIVETYARSGFQTTDLDLDMIIDAGRHLARGEKWPVSLGRRQYGNQASDSDKP